MAKLYPNAAAALEGVLKNDLLTAAGGFALCGIPDRPLDGVHLPGVYVNRLIVGAPYDKKIEFRTVKEPVA